LGYLSAYYVFAKEKMSLIADSLLPFIVKVLPLPV